LQLQAAWYKVKFRTLLEGGVAGHVA